MNKKFQYALFGVVLFIYANGCVTIGGQFDPAKIVSAVNLLPETYRQDARKALEGAGKNADELIAAIQKLEGEEREGLAFLLSNMPAPDLKSLRGDFLVENARLAYQAREAMPWGKNIPEEIFLNDVLPYFSVNERRDNWRPEFYRRFARIARESGTIEKAVLKLNELAFEELGVSYHASKRPKPDQSPYESIRAKYASCTGLSILIVDVLRAVGIPARMAGIYRWKEGGNHTWVEVWDGEWHHIGAAEPAPYDQAWFNERAVQTDNEHPIYAASFKHTGLKFPMAWNESIDWVSAVDVTSHYKK